MRKDVIWRVLNMIHEVYLATVVLWLTWESTQLGIFIMHLLFIDD